MIALFCRLYCSNIKLFVSGNDKQYSISESEPVRTGKYDKKVSTQLSPTTTSSKSKSTIITSAASLARGDVKIKRKQEGFYTKLQVEKLPQTFPVRCMGSVPCSGLYGLEHVKEPLGILIDLYSGNTSRSLHLSYNSACLHACPRSRIEISAHTFKISPSLDRVDNDNDSNVLSCQSSSTSSQDEFESELSIYMDESRGSVNPG